jgi:hypothetical protein
MNILNGVWIILLAIGSQAMVWSIIFYRIGLQAEAIKAEARRSGEMIILGPVRANYQGRNGRFVVAKTIGTLALLDRRLLFKRPIGRDVSIPLAGIAVVSDAVTSVSLKHNFGDYVSLDLRSGANVVFLVPDANRWISAIRERLVPA